MAHVTHTGFALGLRLFTGPLAIDNGISNVGRLEERDGKGRVIATVHRTIEDLLDDIIDDIVKKVVPGVCEEE